MQAENLLEVISGRIAAVSTKLTSLRDAGATLAAERGKVERTILADAKARDEAAEAHATAQASHALGEVDASALRLALDALTAAEKAVSRSSAQAPEVARIAAAVRQLAARAAPLETELVALNAELVEAKKEARLSRIEVEMREGIARYTKSASETMVFLGRAFAMHQVLQAEGRDPGLSTAALLQSQLGAFAGSPLTGSFAESVAAERARLAAVA
jgi:DNA-binding transcriptional ArsR family regulator